MSGYEEIAPDALETEDKSTHPVKYLDTVVALYDFPGTQPSHLPLNLGDTIWVLSKSSTGWWDGVIKNNSGQIMRGWFSKTYVRSVNYVQPMLTELRGREVDSITAANTAANVLIPSFASLLQGKLTSERSASNSRKNSMVSFEVEDKKSNGLEKPNSAADTLLSPYSGSKDSLGSRSPEKEKDIVYDPSASVSTYGQSMNLSMSGASGSGGGNSFSGNSLGGTPNAAGSTIGHFSGNSSGNSVNALNTEVNILDVSSAEMLAENYQQTHKTTLTWVARVTTDGDYAFYNEQLNIYSNQIPMTTYAPPPGETKLSLALPSHKVLERNEIVDMGFTYDEAQPLEIDMKRNSNASSMNSTGSSSAYHHFSKPLFAIEGLFFSNPSDLTKWTDISEQTSSALDLLLKALVKHNKHLFSNVYFHLNKSVSILFLSCKLVRGDFLKTKYYKSIRKNLRIVANAISRIYNNGLLHLNMMHYENPQAGNILNFEIEKLNKSTSQPSSTTSSVATNKPSSVPSTGVSSPISTRDYPSTSDQHSKEVSRKLQESDVSYLDQLEYDIELLRTSVNTVVKLLIKTSEGKKVRRKDYDESDTSEDEGISRSGVLPQVHPRFISGEFNGGNWCNPFFSQSKSILNASGDELKNRRHSKIILDQEAYKQVFSLAETMKKLSDQTLEYLNPDIQHKYYNDNLKNERNNQILRLVYKLLYYGSQLIDTIEAFDFTVFCLIKKSSLNEYDNDSKSENQSVSHLHFDYPVVLEFFEVKQKLHDYVSRLLLESQNLTLEDPEVFKGIKEEKLIYNRNVMKDPNEKISKLLVNILSDDSHLLPEDPIIVNADEKMLNVLKEGAEKTEYILDLIQQLIDERETILNYATRVMHDDFNVQLLVMERNNTISSQIEKEEHYYSGKKQDDTPWYLDGDDEYDLLMDIKGNIKGGSKEALVAYLTHHEVYDAAFISSFLVTFSTIMSFSEFLSLLIQRYKIEAPEGLSYEEYNTWIAKKETPIKIKVLSTMKFLLEKYWSNSYFNRPIIEKWLKFLELPAQKNIGDAKIIKDDLQRLLNGEIVCVERKPVIVTGKTPAPLVNKSYVKKLKLLDIDYVELARQLTIKEFNMYSKITMHACIAKVWNRKSGLNEPIDAITNFIKTSNQLTNYVAYMILRKQDVKKRVQLIRYFIQVAEKCRQLNNYSSMTAIISALYSSPIHRLKKTWKYVSTDTLSRLQNMNRLMNSSRNFNEYRDVLKFVGSEPCIPFFGVVLSDLTFVLHGNSDFLMNRPWMTNFSKRGKTYEIVLGMDKFRKTGYNLQEVKEIQNYLSAWFEKCPTIDEQYQLSLNLEPREPQVSSKSSRSLARGSRV